MLSNLQWLTIFGLPKFVEEVMPGYQEQESKAGDAMPEFKVGDTVRLRTENPEPYKTEAPMTVASINKAADGTVTIVCNRQGLPVGEYPADQLMKVPEPPDAAAEAAKQKAEAMKAENPKQKG